MSLALTLLALLAILAAAPRFFGLRSQRPADFASQSPAFDPRKHLSGPILCEGMITGPFGRVTSRFVARMEGVWDGNRGTLREEFRYDSGEQQHREWRLTISNDGTLRAEADDLVGTGTGRIAGPAVQMLYNLRLPKSAGGHVLRVTDWMILAENGTILNRSQFTKFGIPVAQLFATMRRVNA